VSLAEYHHEYMQEIYARAGSEQNFYQSVFLEQMSSLLEDQGLISGFNSVEFKKTARGLAVDGWDYDEDLAILSLFLVDFRPSDVLDTITQTEISRGFKRLERFLTESLKSTFVELLEESAPIYELANEIRRQRKDIARVRFYLLTNAQLSSRAEAVPESSVADFRCTFDIWDISRVHRIESSGRAREDVVLDLTVFDSQGLRCLPAYIGENSMESYILVVPGLLLAQIYDEYGDRLLEQNVRTFLQFRGKINKGIRNTIQNEPHMFFAYNNGLTTTAEDVETSRDGERILRIKNLQVVNGGQTTASIFTAMKKHKADIDKVYVQVKLSVVPSELVDAVVPRISEFANTQNKINAADFFSNHPFHLRIQDISRRLWAPSPEGSLRETHWFYERTRGQYANHQATLTPKGQREFLIKNPRQQMFSKTDLAKFVHSFESLPHKVSEGAQKNFSSFAGRIGERWEKDETQFNDLWFKRLIGKAILFRYMDKVVMKQDWYGGYKANIVSYSLAKLGSMVTKSGRHIDFVKIWREQAPSESMSKQLLEIAQLVNRSIQDTPDGISNVTEWSKKQACWHAIESEQLALNSDLLGELLDREENAHLERNASDTQIIQTGIQAQTYVFEKGAAYWTKLDTWNRSNQTLSQKEVGILSVARGIPDRFPTEKQAKVLIEAEKRALEDGFHE
jgi:hypothetical protein